MNLSYDIIFMFSTQVNVQRKRQKGISPVIIFTGFVLLLWIFGSLMFMFRSFQTPFRQRVLEIQSNEIKPKTFLQESSFGELESTRSMDPQLQAAKDLIVRAVGKEASEAFDLDIPKVNQSPEYFQIEDLPNGKISLRGTSGVALASALNWYLRYYCLVDTSWYSHFPLKLPTPLPPIGKRFRRDSLVQWSYYENVCTFSYTQAWWDWARWEREIDWMAMHGINLPLSLTGQEYVMQRVFERFGLTPHDLEEYFTGPGFLAWNRMINIKAWGGPLPQDFMLAQAELQRKILARERSLGMTPVLPAFSGGVPDALARLFPSARFHRHGNWGGFEQRYCCVLTLAPEDPLFRAIGRAFVEEESAAYGSDHIYSADTFNENRPGAAAAGGPAALQYLRASSAAVYGAMADADPQAVWLMQGWLFMNDAAFWKAPELEAYLGGVPPGRMIVLDLFTDVFPVWKRRDLTRPTPIERRPWIWNMLHSFGGNTGMYGRIQVVSKDPVLARAESPDMVGIGITTEGIEQNPIMYELMAEMRWADAAVDPVTWAHQWAARRMGPEAAAASPRARQLAEEAWELLASSVHSCTTTQMGQVKSMIESRPRLDLHTGYIRNSDFMPIRRHYPDSVLVKAWYRLMYAYGFGREPEESASGEVPAEPPTPSSEALAEASAMTTSASRYDLVDITRQVLSDHFARMFVELTAYFQRKGVWPRWHGGQRLPTSPLKSSEDAEERMEALERIILDLDRLLGTQEWLLLGRWIGMARAWGTSMSAKDHMEFNARNVLTLWGPRGEIADYASKQWNGLLADFYLPRWKLFFKWVRSSLSAGEALNEPEFHAALLEQEKAWQTRTSPTFPSVPSGDVMQIVAQLRARYGAAIRSSARRHDEFAAVDASGKVVHAPGADLLSDDVSRLDASGGDANSNVRAGVARPDQ